LLCFGEAFALTFVPSIEMLEPIKPISLQNVKICKKISLEPIRKVVPLQKISAKNIIK
jgi:hypothetical protein